MNRKEKITTAIHSLLEETFGKSGYPYFTEESDGCITLHVKMKNGEYITFGSHTPNNPYYLDSIGGQGGYEKYCMENLNDFYNKIPLIVSALQGIESLTTSTGTKNTYFIHNTEDKGLETKFELRSLPPSSLKFSSYEELCRYCAVPENFTDEAKANDILAVIEAAEEYFPVRLNELAREMGFPETDNCIVNIPKVGISNRRDVLGMSYAGWNRIELSIKLLGYDEKVREGIFNHQLRCTANVYDSDAWKKSPLKYLVKPSSEPDYFTCNKRLNTLLEQFYDDEDGSRII
jgi:hypothetical protein